LEASLISKNLSMCAVFGAAAALSAGVSAAQEAPKSAPAAQTPPASATGQAAEKAEAQKEGEEELICQRVQVTGSRMTQRICMTPAQARALEQQNRRTVDGLRNRPTRNDPVPR
jgi:hypothetical protein